MGLSKEEIEKIYSIKEKLLVTYRAATSEKLKREISKNLNDIEKIIIDIEDGRPIEPSKLNIFSDELKKTKQVKKKDQAHGRINYIAKVEILSLSDKCKDQEMNEIYSFIMFYEKNFLSPFSATYLKLDYYLSKKRDVMVNHYESLKMLLKEYVDDLDVLYSLRFNEQIEKYKARMNQQKKYFLVKVSEFLHEIKDFINEVLSDYKSGRKSFFNPDEIFESRIDLEEMTEFEGFELKDILQEFEYFIDDFIEILRMPDFRKNQ